MNIASMLIAACIVIFGIAYQQAKKTDEVENTMSKPSQIQSTQQEPSPTLVPAATTLPTHTATPPPASVTPTIQKTNTLTAWIYPTSTIQKQTENRLELSSTSYVKDITSWYESKIKELSFSAQSIVKTSANEKTTNVLVAAKNSQEIRVEIMQENKSLPTNIVVTIKQ